MAIIKSTIHEQKTKKRFVHSVESSTDPPADNSTRGFVSIKWLGNANKTA